MYRFHKTAVAAIFGVTALGLAGVAQAAFVPQTFTVDETQLDLGGSLEGGGYIFDADGFSGNYVELLTIDPDGSFDATAWWRAGTFVLGTDNPDTNVRVGGSGSPDTGYGLYVIFDSSGTVTTDGFTGDTGEISFYLDPLRDTTFDFSSTDAADGVTVGATSDDILIGSSTFLREAAGVFRPNTLAQGDFALLFDDFQLTADGSRYFVDPEPFFQLLRVSGQFGTTAGDLVPGTERVSFLITGSSADGQFGVEIPTPGVIGLFGIGLVGLGLVARRRKPIAS